LYFSLVQNKSKEKKKKAKGKGKKERKKESKSHPVLKFLVMSNVLRLGDFYKIVYVCSWKNYEMFTQSHTSTNLLVH
jgi:hypothetical protein